jgi:hypothetical protein
MGTLTDVGRGGSEESVTLKLEKALLDRLARQRDKLRDGVAAREFGLQVDITVAARVALIRGLSAMESGRPAARSGAVQPQVEEAEDARTTEAAETAAPVRSEPGANGRYETPEGWVKWDGRERVPPEHAALHEYYISNGWWRYWGRAGDERIHFYWCDNAVDQDLALVDVVDGRGKGLLLQETPWGPGHIIPHGWTG